MSVPVVPPTAPPATDPGGRPLRAAGGRPPRAVGGPSLRAAGGPRVARALLPDRDLAADPPGAAARTQAIALRDAAPLRTVLERAFGVRSAERAWRIGADGERETARRLAGLGDGWRVLHAVPVGDRGSDIDHVLIGPAGVFTINTKHRPGASVWVAGDHFRVNGQPTRYVASSRFEAQRAAALLTAARGRHVAVQAVVAVVGTSRVTIKRPSVDVLVLRSAELRRTLRRRPVVLTPDEVEVTFEVARHLATWRPTRVQRARFAD